MVRFKLVTNGTDDLRIRDTYKRESFYIYGSIRYIDARRKPPCNMTEKMKIYKDDIKLVPNIRKDTK